MGVSLLHPHDLPSPHRQKKPIPNRHRHQVAISPPPTFIPKGTKKKNLNHTNNNNINIVSNHVRILKRGEDIGKEIPDPAIEKPDLKPTHQMRSDPVKIPTQIRNSDRKSKPALFYAGPVTSTSPPPSEVPLPAFFAKKSPADATNDLIRLLRIDVS